MNIQVLSLFPPMFEGVFQHSIMKKAQDKGAVTLGVVDIREFADNKRQVDDYPFGGGAGMVLKPEPVFNAVESITNDGKKPRVILMCPQGERFTQKKAEELAREEELVFICGHYEGYDERIREHLVTDEISIGDFVLTGGELAAMTVIDSVVRLLPGVLGNSDSPVRDSFSTGLLEHPHYTRPADFRGMVVPSVLTSGNHAKIEDWREEQGMKRTFERRPDLLDHVELSDKQKNILARLQAEK
ncbi:MULTISPECIES: tRNA (guanosine(37)-N1)-methyltransferase TrmD [unclassified Planococcus (in: firmicutes)]|uniref:tRNA (guanosine(37)-N1)-methyltransferase TrmD n=1 Tax=unclassified Planococcus (in: firmicutes) TaxID=2662419 RepID=UPI000C34A0FB|nr:MULTISPECIES: tRNA (guanosine(37)-N1)-methyltransferase TrmD [unclassified Planococcus (in: firmicutes)]AUD15336.1 tRNA (guanosine(37)-N1)-methyltransferase TrmD [Planococcus sp. MB-3u-03]PKG48364.1 tRNA (guanosine(37)-N1)-methyltransferase TrmD [Planococcus sp. Urea-trap-24]PKG92211.1 tRNA (guanosine(37)-N1)-methyltransferase TrmD [Planococcus sp. Urea-3u-39]PKH43354.1 tRNA (guanosine(37)-N1)-methyltransferase TrmD [Planococcus sp. MB-3u-09]